MTALPPFQLRSRGAVEGWGGAKRRAITIMRWPGGAEGIVDNDRRLATRGYGYNIDRECPTSVRLRGGIFEHFEADRTRRVRSRYLRSSPGILRKQARNFQGRRVREARRSSARPRQLYDTAIFSTGIPVSTSSLVTARPQRPFSLMGFLSATMSSHPQRRGLPVVAPNSLPTERMSSPVSSRSSEGNGPPPTRVV